MSGTPALMIQGTGSNVGKSMLVAGLIRAFRARGLKAVPFKPQNMSNNAAVTADGGEIGRAQALQARAAGMEPTVHMNPVLLKPETEKGAQVVVQGRRLTTCSARDYGALKPQLLEAVLDSFRRVGQDADLVVVEGAGSPAEVNLRAGDIANMGFAEAADVPVVLAGDIDRGGVIAQVVGSHAVLDGADRRRIRGFLINKFRGDVTLFDDGYRLIEERTGWPGFGILPWFPEAHRLPAEDAADIRSDGAGQGPKIAVLHFSRIANFDDFDPLKAEPGVTVVTVKPGHPIPGDASLVILPGTKSTRGDLALLREAGWDIDLRAHVRRGGRLLGICGGYQMLGRRIADPDGLEGAAGTVDGLGFLDVETVMTPEKSLTRVGGKDHATGEGVAGYEIHIGRTSGPDCARPLLTLDGHLDGARSADGRIAGCYLHGIFNADGFRRAFLSLIGASPSAIEFEPGIDTVLDRLGDHVEAHLNLDGLLRIARSAPS